MKNTQRGATLIVVLVLLLVIMVIGTLAIRSSLMSLNIATNGQAQQLLIQNSDAAIFNVEDPDRLVWNQSKDGLFGYVTDAANKGKELVFCYRGTQSQFFQSSKTSVMMWQSGSNAPSGGSTGTDGYCQVGHNADYTSGRKAVMTQVAIKSQISASDAVAGIDTPFGDMQRGTDTDSSKIEDAQRIVVVATSIVPAMSQASDNDINACFSQHMNQVVIPLNVTPDDGANKSVSECLQALGVPFTTQVSEYSLIQNVMRQIIDTSTPKPPTEPTTSTDPTATPAV